MSGPRIISNIEALEEVVKGELPDLIIIGRRSTSNIEGKRRDPKTITIETFMELVTSGANILIDEDSFISNSASKAPTQRSTKKYIAAQLASGGFNLIDDDSMSAASRTQAATQGSIKVYIDDSVTFTNPVGETTVRSTFGDVKTGVTNINGLTYQQIFELMYFPYASPSFTSFTLDAVSTIQEIGASIPQTRTFSWTYGNSANVSTSTTAIVLTDLGTGYLPAQLGVAKSPTNQSVTFNSVITSTAPGTSVSFRIIGTNTKNTTFSRDYHMRFYGKVIWGTHTDPTIDTAKAGALTSKQNALTGNMTSDNGNDIVGSQLAFNPSGGAQYSYLLVPVGVQLPNDIRNTSLPANANSFDMYQNQSGQTNIALLTDTGIIVSYRVFRSNNASNASSTCLISN
jgi:hypothetical protein